MFTEGCDVVPFLTSVHVVVPRARRWSVHRLTPDPYRSSLTPKATGNVSESETSVEYFGTDDQLMDGAVKSYVDFFYSLA